MPKLVERDPVEVDAEVAVIDAINEAAGGDGEASLSERDREVQDAFHPTPFAEYLLSRRPAARIGRRRSFTDNLVARYLTYQLSGEWLVTKEAAMNPDTMETYQLPLLFSVLLEKSASDADVDGSITANEAIRMLLPLLADPAYHVTQPALSLDGAS